MGGVASNEHRASGTNKISISFSLFSPLTFFFSFTLGRERERGASSLAIGQLAWQLQHTPNKNLVSSKPQQHVIDSHLLRNVLFFFCLPTTPLLSLHTGTYSLLSFPEEKTEEDGQAAHSKTIRHFRKSKKKDQKASKVPVGKCPKVHTFDRSSS